YTYKVNDLNFLEDHPIQNIKDYILLEKFSITVEEHSDLERSLNMVLRIKEYNERWRHGGVLDRNSLTAVYKINVELDKNKNKVTFNAGNDQINEVTKKFVTQALNWPIISYRILEKTNQSYQIGNASFKTAILLDFINNRLNPNGIDAKFKEIKFNTRGKLHNNEGIRNVTINGNDILSSQLACEYITLGSGIVSFKLSMTYEEQSFSAIFSLKGKDSDIMKIVIVDLDGQDIKEEIMDIIQEHYIEMCIEGIRDMDSTKRILETIYDKYSKGDKFVFQVIQDSVLKVNRCLLESIEKTGIEDDFYDLMNDIVHNNKIILDAAGYSGINEDLDKIMNTLESDFTDLDEDDVIETEGV